LTTKTPAESWCSTFGPVSNSSVLLTDVPGIDFPLCISDSCK